MKPVTSHVRPPYPIKWGAKTVLCAPRRRGTDVPTATALRLGTALADLLAIHGRVVAVLRLDDGGEAEGDQLGDLGRRGEPE